MLKDTRGQSITPLLTIAFVFVNILLFLIIYSFGHDGYTVGTAGNVYTLSENQSLSSAEMSYSDASFFSTMKNGFSGLPIWAALFLGIFETAFISILIFSWVRGN